MMYTCLVGECYKVFAYFHLPAVGFQDFQPVVLQLAVHILAQEVGDQLSYEFTDLFRDLTASHSDVVHGVLRGKFGNFAVEGAHVEVGGAFPVVGLHYLQRFAVRDEEAELVHEAPAVVKAHGELDHKLAADCHVHDGPVTGGGGVLVHDVHMLVGIEVGDVQTGGAILGEDGGQGVGVDRSGGAGGMEVEFHSVIFFVGAKISQKNSDTKYDIMKKIFLTIF